MAQSLTYQQVCLAPAVFQRACRSRPTLLIFDELHHAGEGKDWGNALLEAFDAAVFRLALSGTPFRSDNNPIPYVRYEQGESQADFTYGYAEAIRESVCRPILFPSYEGELTWLSDGCEHRATFEDGLTVEIQRERLKTALLQNSWLGPVITDAHAELRRLRKQEQPDCYDESRCWRSGGILALTAAELNRMPQKPASFVLASKASPTYPRGYASGAFFGCGLVEHPVETRKTLVFAQP